MAFPISLTEAVDSVTEIVAAHLNNLEEKVGIDDSEVVTSLDYLLKNTSSVDPGHTHSIYGTFNVYNAGTNLNSIISTIGAANATVIVDQELTLTTYLAIPANVSLVINKPGLITISEGDSLTINGPFTAGLYQVFNDENTDLNGVVFGAGAVNEVYPEWWAVNTTPGITDMTDAITCAIKAAMGGNATLRFGGTRYLSGKWPDIGEHWLSIIGEEDGTSMIIFDVDADNCIEVLPGNVGNDICMGRFVMKNLRFHTANHIPTNIIFLGGALSTDMQIFDACLSNLSCGYNQTTSTYPYATGAFIYAYSTSYLLLDRIKVDIAYLGQGIRTAHSNDYTPATIGMTIKNSKLSNILTAVGYDGIGLQVDGCAGLWVRNSIIQGCRGGGVKATQTAGPVVTVWNFVLDGMHFELNVGYDLEFTGTATAYLTPVTLRNSQFYYTAGTNTINLSSYGRYVIEDCIFNNNLTITNVGFNLIMRNCQGTVTAGAGANYYTDENRRVALWPKTDDGSDVLTSFSYGGSAVKLFNLTDKGSLGLLATNGPVGSDTLNNTGATTTVVSNSIVTASSLIYIFPTSANAAAAVGAAAGVYVSAKSAGTSFTLTHPASPGAGATFNYLIIN